MTDTPAPSSRAPERAEATQTENAEAAQAAQPGITAEQAMAELTQGLARIERERNRIRREDWETLFRQMQTLLVQLATHPFVVGDEEAEHLIHDVTRADDLEELDARLDLFADYAVRKIEFNLAVRAAQTGEAAELPRYLTPGSSTTQATRAAASHGPSGSDFDIPGTAPAPDNNADPQPPRRPRGVMRL